MPNGFQTAPTTEETEQLLKTQGIAPFRTHELHEIAIEAQKRARLAEARGRFGPKEREAKKALIERAKAEYSPYQTEEGETLNVEILPGFETSFTPLELVKILKDENFARSIYRKATHIENPSRDAIKFFQQRIERTYPTLPEIVQKGMRKKYFSEYSPFALPPKTEREKVKRELEQDVKKKGEEFDKVWDERRRIYKTLPADKQREIDDKVESTSVDYKHAKMRAALLPTTDSVEQHIMLIRKKLEEKRKDLTDKPFDHSTLSSAIELQEQKEALELQETLKKEISAGNITSVEQANELIEKQKDLDPDAKRYVRSELEKYFSGASKASREAMEAPLSSVDESKTYKRLEGVRKLRDLERSAVQVAPLNMRHAEAEDLVRRAQQGTEAATAAQQRRAQRREEAIPPSPQILGEWERGRQALAEADAPFQEQIEKHFNPYWQKAYGARRELSDEQWKKIEPRIRASYVSMGAQNSPAMHEAIRTAYTQHQDKLRREEDILQARLYDQARHSAAIQQQHALSRGREHASLGHHQQEQLTREEVLAQQAVAQQAVREQMDVAAMGQLAHQQQVQKQNEMQAQEREFNEETARPLQLLEAQSAISRGLTPTSLSSVVSIPPAPAPPSGANVLAGVLGAAQGLRQAVAKGGRIKSKFAHGGMPSWSHLNQQLQEDRYAPQQERIAQDLTDYQFDPVRNLMSRVSPHLMMARQGQGHYAIGHGMAEHFNDQRAAYDKRMLMKEKAANLYHAMNRSLMDQKHFLADYESKKASHAETGRYHDIMAQHHQRAEEENRRHHQAAESFHEQLLNQKSSQISKEDNKAIIQEKDRIRDAIKLQSTLDKLQKLYGRLGTGPNRGALAENKWDTTAALSGMGSVDEIAEARALSNKLVTEIHQTMKNIPRAHAFVELIQSAKPNFRNPSPTNLKVIEDLQEGPAMALAHAKAELKDRGMNEEEIDSYIKEMTSATHLPKSRSASHNQRSSSFKKMSTRELEAYRNQLQAMVG
jgi:hypothetical protein